MNPKKVIISSKQNLQVKYGSGFDVINALLQDLARHDLTRDIDTQIIYIDDHDSALAVGIQSVASISQKSFKKGVDQVFDALQPAYIVLFGSQDIVPFQEIINTTEDADSEIPSDLPYACNTAYSTDIENFTGPTRVVGRIPDIPGKADLEYVKAVIQSIIDFQPSDSESLDSYFSLSTDIWQRSTHQSLNNIFGNSLGLKISPVYMGSTPSPDLHPLIHFYNCHGSLYQPKFYGQKDNDYPEAIDSGHIENNIRSGTIVAAECCYGAQLYNPDAVFGNHLSIANTYLGNNAIAFMGSSTIAYGPADSQGLADLITQYFIKFMLRGYSSGRAMLEARQKFLTESGPDLDPYELKTLAQFNLLGDPSIQVIKENIFESRFDTVDNRRLSLFNKGTNLKATMSVSVKIDDLTEIAALKTGNDVVSAILKESGFKYGEEKEYIYSVKAKSVESVEFSKQLMGSDNVIFRTFVQKGNWISKEKAVTKVLVIKEIGDKILGSRVYHRK